MLEGSIVALVTPFNEDGSVKIRNLNKHSKISIHIQVMWYM